MRLRPLSVPVLAAGAALGAWPFVEPHLPVLRRVAVPVLPPSWAPLRLLHVSDLHLLPRHVRMAAWIRALAALEPDLVVSTGDHVSSEAAFGLLAGTLGALTADGTPVRATVQLTLQEVPRETAKNQRKGQNPTSVARGARKARMIQPGDTLDWIASDELGDPNAWRILADANGIEDPRRLRAGQVLLIPEEV